MKRLLAAAALLTSLISGPAAAVDARLAHEVVADAAAGIVPAYARLAAETSALKEGVAALCATPSGETLDAARRDFSEAADAWARVEMVRFGPVTGDNRLERILYWPDRRSIGLKQVQALLAERDASATSVDTLIGKSVAVQGFGALEFVLFGAGGEALGSGEDYRCAYGSAIAANLAALAAGLEDAWKRPGGFVATWTTPGAGNPLYRDDQEALTEVIDTLVHGLEMLRDVRLNGFLGETPDDDKPRQALFWRSGKTVDMLLGNLDSLERLFTVSGLERALPEDGRWIAQSIAFEFANARRALEPLADVPIADALKDADMRGKLAYARLVTSSLSDIIGRHLTGALGLTAGFSSLDGD